MPKWADSNTKETGSGLMLLEWGQKKLLLMDTEFLLKMIKIKSSKLLSKGTEIHGGNQTLFKKKPLQRFRLWWLKRNISEKISVSKSRSYSFRPT